MLVDANLLLYAVDTRSPFHDRAREWLTGALNGRERVGLPWQCLTAFVRIATHPRAAQRPLTPAQAWEHVSSWLACEVAWTPLPTNHHAEVLGALVVEHDLRGNLVSDAHLAALAIEHGLKLYSADSDFARFPKLTWVNPLVSG
ncbi:PIN domain-containing protein [Natronosporangium hydrolyticum]|uniref:Ribonuclease VapC n=1 Tax=Natronosporangium hydrolyticum TaxID=2811111 RepID=A0A895YLC1_9ACTN|nr:TA system VapC family ribonuclease toxin [Natronosporangium hydrolyticum]QSB16103.1 PIN domain-containing protein [Natronosporangium hydrolyticum]